MAQQKSGKSPMTRGVMLVLALLGGGTSLAGDDHDRARRALEAGEILPLRAILDRVDREYPGRIMAIELERREERGRMRWHYEIKLLRADGALVKLRIDARDGTLLDLKGKHERGQHGGEPR